MCSSEVMAKLHILVAAHVAWEQIAKLQSKRETNILHCQKYDILQESIFWNSKNIP